jgi:hypothetical protein
MADRLSWWVIPGALVVLLRLGTLAAPAAPATDGGDALPTVRTSDPTEPVVVRDASGNRSTLLSADLLTQAPFVLTLPAELVGQRCAMTLWRRLPGGREATPWLELRPRVRGDATIPIAGLTPGRYDLEVRADGDDVPFLLRADDVAAPGQVSLVPASPVR